MYTIRVLECSKPNSTNFNDWIRNIRMVTHYEDKEFFLDKELKEIDESSATPEEIVKFRAHEKDATKVDCIMLTTMISELKKYNVEFYPLRCTRT